ncbi:MAG: hypothetical protein H6737_03220 [Alphaproteobacteria bacterium]|nr:hypothetical protein [Alphaproteobacteria bacterium]
MWFVLLALSSAYAGESATDLTSPEGRQAEYVRLAEEMYRATKRNNWTAVERLYGQLDEMGMPHTFQVLTNAAHAARNRGDITTARVRLIEASRIQDSKEIKDWLWDIQNDFGPVKLAADLPANYRLECPGMPFEPLHRKAVEFAQQEIMEKSYFEGILPRTDYVFRPYGESDESRRTFKFSLRADKQTFDLRTHDEPTRADRKKRERIDRKIAKQEAREQG